MDVVQARTFLAVVETGSFLAAASAVNVAQSTVSSRIKALEDELGRDLFERNKSGAHPTPAGLEFARHAWTIVRVWDQARQTVALPEDHRKMLRIGGQPSLWDGFLLKWLPWMRKHADDVAIQARMVASSPVLMQQMMDGLFDMIVLYRPVARPGVKLKQIFEEHLVLVSSEPSATAFEEDRYIYVDWGPEFQSDHALNFPDLPAPAMNLDVGSLGIGFLLENRASGYFPLRIAEPYIQTGELKVIDDAPIFTYPTYAAWIEDTDPALVTRSIDGLIKTARNELPEPEDIPEMADEPYV